MKRLLVTLLALLYLASMAPGQFTIAPASAPKFSISPAKFQITPAPVAVKTYAEARDEAIRSGKPLVVWLGYPPSFSPGDVIHWHTPETDWCGYRGPGVVVSVPWEGNRLVYVAEITASDVTAEKIARTIAGARGRTWAPPARPPAMFQPMPMQLMGGGRGGSSC